MARREARIFTSVWQDSDFLALTPEAQRMYFLLLSQPELSMCGRLTPADVLDCLQQLERAQPRAFAVADYDTDEVLIRSFIRRDHVLQGPKLLKPLAEAIRIVRSPVLKRVLRDELQAAQDEPMHPSAPPLVEELLKYLSSQVDTLSIPYSEKRDRVQEKEEGVSTTPYVAAGAVQSLTGTVQALTGAVQSLTSGSSLPRAPVSARTRRLDQPGDRDDVERLCQHLADRVEQQTGARPGVGVQWRRAARLMLDADKRTEQQVSAAIDWCQDDEFWRSNILSMGKLREKYIQLRAAAQRSRAGNGGGTATRKAQRALDAGRRVQEMLDRKELE
jgi:hypothetical protein